MAIVQPAGTYVSTASTGSTTSSISLTVPALAKAGDILVICAVAERAEIPVVRLNNSTNLTNIRSESSVNISAWFGWRRLVASDLGGSVTVTNSAARRQSLSLQIVENAMDPTFVNQPVSLQPAGVTTKTGPTWTPTVDNSLAVGLWAIARPISPYTGYSFTTAAPFVERTEATSTYATGINATTYTTARLLAAGSANSQQAGNSITCTSAPYDSMSTVLVFAPTTSTSNPQPNVEVHTPMAIIDCTGSLPGNNGTLSYSISPSAGVIEAKEGYFAVPQTATPQVFNITITETGGGIATTPVTVPAAGGGTGTKTGVEIVRWQFGAWY